MAVSVADPIPDPSSPGLICDLVSVSVRLTTLFILDLIRLGIVGDRNGDISRKILKVRGLPSALFSTRLCLWGYLPKS